MTMKSLKSAAILVTLTALISISARNLTAQEYQTDCGGYGYEQSRRVPSLAPAIALGTVAIVAIVAVACQNNGHSSHAHAHD
jgi:hypothetical protein